MEEQIKQIAIKHLSCDDAEIQKVGDSYFLFLCHNRVSKGEWIQRNDEGERPVTFEYVERDLICSGNTLEELMEDLKFHIKILDLPRLEANFLVMKTRLGFSDEEINTLREQSKELIIG